MRDYAKISPQFWIGSTGRKLRDAGPEATLVALYLLSNPHANMLGLYYLPQLYIAHETGLGIEGASNGLRMAIEAGFCDYDADSEVVFVYEMARFQIAERLEPPDKRCTGIQREYDALPNNLFLSNFYEKYVGAFHLKKPREGTSPFEGASKALRSQEQEQEQEQEDKTLLSDPSGSDESVFARQKPPCKTVTIAETSYLLSELETAVEDVFAHFVAVLKKSKLYSLDATRKRHGLARLKECLRAAKPPALENSMAAMKDCIEKLVASKFHNGANSEGRKYLDWDHVFGSAKKFQFWMEQSHGGKEKCA